MKKLSVLACVGGGVRMGAIIGSQMTGQACGKFYPQRYNTFIGTSAGALIASLVACGLSAKEQQTKYILLHLSKLLCPSIPWKMRLACASVIPISLTPLAKEIDSWKLPVVNNLFINAWDIHTNKQVIFCEEIPDWVNPITDDSLWVDKAFSDIGYGKCITRSMAMSVFSADDFYWMSGACYENPPLSFLPNDCHILLLNADSATIAKESKYNVSRRVLHFSVVTQNSLLRESIKNRSNVFCINSGCKEFSASDFDISVKKKQELIRCAMRATEKQWQMYEFPRSVL